MQKSCSPSTPPSGLTPPVLSTLPLPLVHILLVDKGKGVSGPNRPLSPWCKICLGGITTHIFVCGLQVLRLERAVVATDSYFRICSEKLDSAVSRFFSSRNSAHQTEFSRWKKFGGAQKPGLESAAVYQTLWSVESWIAKVRSLNLSIALV
jgi:hypothetical protein